LVVALASARAAANSIVLGHDDRWLTYDWRTGVAVEFTIMHIAC